MRSGSRRSTSRPSSRPRSSRCSSTCSCSRRSPLPVFAAFFLDDAGGLLPLAGVLALVNLGLAATGAIVSTIGAHSRARDLLTPLILLPLLVPLMIAAAGAAEPLLAAGGPDYDGCREWVRHARSLRSDFLLVGMPSTTSCWRIEPR